MTKKKEKPPKFAAAAKEKFTQAESIYMTRLGKISNVELSKIIGVHRVTIQRWKEEGNWEARVTEMEQRIDKETTDRAVAKYTEQNERAIEEIFQTMRLISLASRKRILVTDDKGRPLTDESGQPAVNDKLSPSDLRSITGSMSDYQRMIRIQSGQSIGGGGNGSGGGGGSGEPSFTKHDVMFEKAVRKILETGDADGQEALMKMVECRQIVMGFAGGEGE